jgi:Zn finger protein HypA/HybF involved in hydrogenase expression
MNNFNMRTNVSVEKRECKNAPCLSCGEKFLSEGSYNRICAKCNSINEKIRAASYPVIFRFTELAGKLE